MPKNKGIHRGVGPNQEYIQGAKAIPPTPSVEDLCVNKEGDMAAKSVLTIFMSSGLKLAGS